jgi:hypothetical protein
MLSPAKKTPQKKAPVKKSKTPAKKQVSANPKFHRKFQENSEKIQDSGSDTDNMDEKEIAALRTQRKSKRKFLMWPYRRIAVSYRENSR